MRRVRLVVEETHVERTQQFTLSWVPAGEAGKRELVRQQFTFSPGGATREVEDFAFDLGAVKAIELEIVPDLGGGATRAALAAFQVG